jgi:pimeloyl-ACP methyl ester carboxylesterase
MTTTDLVVVVPGIMGSTLGRTDRGRPARDDLVWAPSAGAALRAVRNFLGNMPRMRLPDGIGDDHPDDHIEPVALMPDLHVLPGLWTPVKGYDRLVALLNRLGYHEQDPTAGSRPGNLLCVPYDWRLSNRYNGHRLASIVDPALDRWRSQGGQYQDAKLVFICHSMGGLVAGWYLYKCGGAQRTRKLITLGTPWRGTGVALNKLVNGTTVGKPPIRLALTEFARSLPSMYQLLPDYACIQSGTDHLTLTETTVPHINATRAADASAFHTDLAHAEQDWPSSLEMTHTIVGTRQPTWTTAHLHKDDLVALETFGTDNDYGDGTVPLTGAVGHNQTLDTPWIKRVAEQHGSLQHHPAVFDEIEEILLAKPVRRRFNATYPVRVKTPDAIEHGASLPVTADLEDDPRHALKISIIDEHGRTIQARLTKGHTDVQFEALPPGAYTIEVAGTHPGSPVSPVTATTVVWDKAIDPEWTDA